MYLKRLEIHGFKSFANKTAMEFSQGIIAIVGPNGSGKSNVADALRWVLGEQSAKMIRGKNSQDVIFAGSDKKMKMGFGEVFATFDNRDRRIPVDAAEVSIGRRIDRSGESEYLINGNRVRLLDIVDLVLKSNIGTSRYTVIGQGTIDQMVMQGPAEIKNLLDEASGVKTYYIRREKTLRRLEQTAQNLIRAEDLIAEIEPRLKSLRRQAKRMEARAEFEQELKIYQREYFGKAYWNLRGVIDQYVQKISVLEDKRTSLESGLQGFRHDAESREKMNASSAGKFGEMQNALSRLQSEKNKLLEDLSLIRGKMQSQKTGTAGDAKTLAVDLHNRTTRIAQIQAQIGETKALQERTEQENAGRRQALARLNGSLEELYRLTQNPASVDWVSFDREMAALETGFQEFYRTLDSSQDISAIKLSAENLQRSFKKFAEAARLGRPREDLVRLQQQLQETQAQKEELQSQIQQGELDFSRSRLSLEFLEKELQSLSQERMHLDLELKKSQAENIGDFIGQLIEEEKKIQQEVDRLAAEMEHLETLFRSERDAEQQRQQELLKAESEYRLKQDELSKLKDGQSALQIEKAKYDAQMEALEEEVRRVLGADTLSDMQAAPAAGETADLEGKIARLKNQLDSIGGMDDLTLKEYQETEARYGNLTSQVQDLKNGMQDLRSVMDELDEHIKTKFNEAFHKINEKFEYYFRILFNGGRAYLSMIKAQSGENEVPAGENSEEPENSETLAELRPEERLVQKYEHGASTIVGIDMKATPPGKKLASIQALSGGERALTSIALLCSLLTCFPSPFVVLDEVDAALDDANTIRFGQILGTLAHQTQFITITHNRETMSQANILYGVTMGDDSISKLLSVKLEQARQYAK